MNSRVAAMTLESIPQKSKRWQLGVFPKGAVLRVLINAGSGRRKTLDATS